MNTFKIAVLVLVAALTTRAQQTKPSTAPQSPAKPKVEKHAPVFHGIQLGATLESQKEQIPKCNIDLYDTSGLYWRVDPDNCYKHSAIDTHDNAPEVQYLYLKMGGSFRSPLNGTVLSIMFDDVTGDATIEGISIEENSDNTQEDFDALREKYGTPTCNGEKWRTGIGIPLAQLVCNWTMPWGTIRLQSSTKEDINKLEVEARTNRLLKQLKEEAAEDRKAAKDKF